MLYPFPSTRRAATTGPGMAQRRNQAVIDYLDTLSNVDAAEAAEQRETRQILERGDPELMVQFVKWVQLPV